MQVFQNKIAVITGGASGIGFALARYCASEGMKVVLADIEEAALTRAEKQIQQMNAPVLAYPCDVSKAEDMSRLAQTALDAFGGVHLFFNNAGVIHETGVLLWERTIADWEWILGVNLWGMIHGIRTFVPIMLEQQTPCHIVNTASIAGLTSGLGHSIYRMTKHAVVSLSESLYYELAQIQANIHVSVLCPGPVQTRIAEAERNRSQALQNKTSVPTNADLQSRFDALVKSLAAGMSADDVAKIVFDAIRNEKFYILTHLNSNEFVEDRVSHILAGRNPPLA